jgi:protein-L-isoaspartate(D-aspartate) O-methyltransferase
MKGLAAIRRDYAKAIQSRAQITSPRIVRAFATVPRERFLGEGPWRIRSISRQYSSTIDANPIHLYQDVLVAIDEDRELDNGLPSLWARLFDLLDIKETDRVVQIGCGSGYYTAILSEVVGAKGRVVAIDCEGALIELARRNLRGRDNVEVIHGDGCLEVGGKTDVIVMHAGFTQPQPLWLDSLRPGGRLMLPLTNENRQGTLFKITRLDTGYRAQGVSGVEIFPCYGRGHTALDKRLMRWWEAISRVRSLRRDTHVEDNTCWLHRNGLCFSTQVLEGDARGLANTGGRTADRR